ncbi:MAG: hypothetical protein RO257_10010 [Candidatus Kapabacteria bacterium]|nr:hypothetical protein [Candidatus Kapabacteria bacterium]
MPIKLLPAINGNPEWGDISGSIDFQTDLSEILETKSPASHNHGLNSLTEKSYNSLDDLPALDEFLNINAAAQLLPCYKLDGTDDYLEIKHSPAVDSGENFSIIIRTSVITHSAFAVIAAKGVRSTFTGWTLFCDYGTVGFSIGDGTKYLTASHSRILTEGKMEQIAVSYDNSEKKLLLGIDNEIEEYDFASLGTPAGNSSPLLIGKNPVNTNYSQIGVHSVIILRKSLLFNDILKLYNNGTFALYDEYKCSDEISLALLPRAFGKYFWFDSSGGEHHASVMGEMNPVYRSHLVIIPLLLITDDLNLSDAVPDGYSIEYVSFYNHGIEPVGVTFSSGSVELISSESVGADSERTFSLQFLPSVYLSSDVSVTFGTGSIEFDVVIILKNQLPVLK